MKLKKLDNISDEILDKIKNKYQNNSNYRVIDKLSTFKKERYFLFSNHKSRAELEWTFIWIGPNLWQFSYLNTHCVSKGLWKSPLEILNEKIKNL